MVEVVPARTSPTLLPPSPCTVLSLSCFKCCSASIVVTSTVRVKVNIAALSAPISVLFTLPSVYKYFGTNEPRMNPEPSRIHHCAWLYCRLVHVGFNFKRKFQRCNNGNHSNSWGFLLGLTYLHDRKHLIAHTSLYTVCKISRFRYTQGNHDVNVQLQMHSWQNHRRTYL